MSTISPSVVFVADLFEEDYAGGAELTTAALIEACPYEYKKIRSGDLNEQYLIANRNSFFIFGNFSNLPVSLIKKLSTEIKYAIVEYDYKFCQYRSIEKHKKETGMECNCHTTVLAKYLSTFYYCAEKIFWMSKEQESRYLERWPFLENKGMILSSVFSKKAIKQFKFLGSNPGGKGWLIQNSDSWIKGTQRTVDWAKSNNKDYELFKGLTHNQVLMKFHNAEGFAFLPLGGDTCPRVVIEAKLLGCELHLNNNVQHANEDWFAKGTPESILEYLENRPAVFWKEIENLLGVNATLSGYSTTYNCISQKYPYEKTIESLLEFCDEVVIVDAGSNDGTWERLEELKLKHDKLKIHQHKVNFDHKTWAIESDGHLKAKARSLCTGDWCWQMDSDEVIHSGQRHVIQSLMFIMPKHQNLLALPVIEYWGPNGKVRIDVNPWKPRLSRNNSEITHGVPLQLRAFDDDGNLYARKGTDSCDYINKETFEYIPLATFVPSEQNKLRLKALQGDIKCQEVYAKWLDQTIKLLPTVYHYSWYDIERKITTYKTHWGKFWKSMYQEDIEDTAENNVCFEKSWSEVTKEDISKLAKRLEEEKGGHIFHTKVDWDIEVPWVELQGTGPLSAKDLE